MDGRSREHHEELSLNMEQTPAPLKSVRVFISSTFRNMHAERDHLVKVVFQELRERVEQPHQ